MKHLNYTENDLLMLKTKFLQIPKNLEKYELELNGNIALLFKLTTITFIGSFKFLFVLPKKTKQNTSHYFAVENSFGAPVLCEWKYNDKNEKIGHLNYGNVNSEDVYDIFDIILKIIAEPKSS